MRIHYFFIIATEGTMTTRHSDICFVCDTAVEPGFLARYIRRLSALTQ